MNRFKCPACGRNQYTAKDTTEGCVYCVYKGSLELMDPAETEKTKQEIDEQLIKLLQSDKEELKRWIRRMEYHCNKVNELQIKLNKYQKLLKRIESSPKMPIERWTGDEREIICPACKSYICYPEDIKTIDLKYRQFCGACGQKLNWEGEGEKIARNMFDAIEALQQEIEILTTVRAEQAEQINRLTIAFYNALMRSKADWEREEDKQ